MQLKDTIYNFRQLYLIVLYKTLLRFRKKKKNAPTNRTSGKIFLKIFYIGLSMNNKVMVDTVKGLEIMILT